MRVFVAGGGPAGLYLALLLKKRAPSWQVVVHERNPRDATFGWGVVFSERTLAVLAQPDPISYARLLEDVQRWDNVDVVHRGEKVSIGGNRFAGVARIALLRVLQDRCLELGVDLAFESPLASPAAARALAGFDLVVGADGVNSMVREAFGGGGDGFAPSLDARRNRYVWYGTPRLFHGLTLTFRANADGLFIAHSYRYGPALSTFIVECDEQSFAAAGLGERDDAGSRRYLEAVFADDLQDAPLLSNASRWTRFTTVRNRRWWLRDPERGSHVVLLGDALHTAHFSIGSGTKLALEDAIALAEALLAQGGGGDVETALAAFEARRRPEVEALQAAAQRSLEWFETARRDLHLDPLAFAYRVMTRSERIDRESLRRRDPEFAAAVERAGIG
jgi:anthraniloyl-CoA monooxygenase